ncbi:MAG: ATP phosphoribosyltransferase regulatory subunit [Firmicutes bacterium]|nr:ATP phosphoribosyltransferase regulatory subunit [Bacillota bacterium]
MNPEIAAEPAYTRRMIPRGTRDFLPPEAARKRALETALKETFSRWGYGEVITPTVEFFECLSLGDGPELVEKMYRLFDREGHTLALRPEVTTPIGRIVATRLREEPLPIRLFYVANVFRYEEPQAGRQREFWQAGVELVGALGPDADAEIVALAVRALEAAGLRDFRVDIGQVGYVNGLLEDGNLGPGGRRALRRALLRRDYVALEEALSASGLSPARRRLLAELPRLRGREEVVRKAAELADNPRSRAAADNLMAVYQALAAHGVQDRVYVDLGMVKDFDYYTGMVLEGYTPELGFPVCTGGRYDNLIGRFGYDCPATGFVVGVERLMMALDAQGSGLVPEDGMDRWLVGSTGAGRPQALAEAASLREKGFAVEVDVMGRSVPELLEYARARTVSRVVFWAGPDDRREFAAPGYGEVTKGVGL